MLVPTFTPEVAPRASQCYVERNEFGSTQSGRRRCVTRLRQSPPFCVSQNRVGVSPWTRTQSGTALEFEEAMMRHLCSAAFVLCFVLSLSACGNGPPSALTFEPPFDRNPTTITRAPGGACPAAQCVYLALQFEYRGLPDEIAIYPRVARGGSPPSAVIAGRQTQLDLPQGMAFNSAGSLYVANYRKITIYAPGVQGNVAPSGVLQGSRTGLARPSGIAFDTAGNLYVVNNATPSVTVYAAGATGNIAPMRTISGSSTQLSYPWGVALDAQGNVYVTNFSSITEYGANAAGNVAPIAVISGNATGLGGGVHGIAFDASANIYVVANQNDIDASLSEFAAGSNGNVAPIRRVVGDNTQMIEPVGLALDRSGDAYVLDWGGDTDYSGMLVFGPQANGDVAPDRALIGRKYFDFRNVGGLAIH